MGVVHRERPEDVAATVDRVHARQHAVIVLGPVHPHGHVRIARHDVVDPLDCVLPDGDEALTKLDTLTKKG